MEVGTLKNILNIYHHFVRNICKDFIDWEWMLSSETNDGMIYLDKLYEAYYFQSIVHEGSK